MTSLKIIKKRLFAIIIVSFIISGCSYNKKNAQSSFPNDQMIMALNWVQHSGEFRALSYQAFNSAKMAFLETTNSKNNLKKAVIVDLDETMIDNSPHAGWQVKNNQDFSEEIWSQWLQDKKSQALPGAVEFSQFVIENGGEIFYISNHFERDYPASAEHLKSLGFAHISPENILFRSEEKDSSNKVSRFEEVKKRGYDIVVYIGDNLNDFSGDTYHQLNEKRKEFVDAHKNEFGRKYIILPNPVYGGWEDGLSKEYSTADFYQRAKIRKDLIQAWNN